MTIPVTPYVSRHERESLPVPLAVYVFGKAVSRVVHRRASDQPARPRSRAVSASHLRDGVVRNLPAGVARAALDPVVVALVGDPQKDLDHGWIGLGDVLALPEMTRSSDLADRRARGRRQVARYGTRSCMCTSLAPLRSRDRTMESRRPGLLWRLGSLADERTALSAASFCV